MRFFFSNLFNINYVFQSVLPEGKGLLKSFVSQDSLFVDSASQDELAVPDSEPDAEDCDLSLSSLEYIPCMSPSFTTHQNNSSDSQQCHSQSMNTHSSHETSLLIQLTSDQMEMVSPESGKKVFVSCKQPHAPNADTSKAFRVDSNITTYSANPYALPLYSDRRGLNSTTTRRQSYAGSYMRDPAYSLTLDDGSSRRRFSMGAEPTSASYNQVGFIDTHCHLDMLYGKLGFRGTFTSFRRLYQSSFSSEFRGCIADFCNPRIMVKEALWEGLLGEDMVWGAFGCHPHFANEYSSVHEDNILKAMRHPKAIAFGEMGLDYSHKNSTASSKQKEVRKKDVIWSEMNTALFVWWLLIINQTAIYECWVARNVEVVNAKFRMSVSILFLFLCRCWNVSCDWLWPCESLW